MAVQRIHVVISGRVQGVGYRYFCQITAQELGLIGWARNRADGGVELEAQGVAAVLNTLQQQLSDGPPMARVDRVDVETIEPLPDETQFRIRY
jgi:acylphosphatase